MALAEPTSPRCEAIREQAGKSTQSVKSYHQALQRAQRQTRLVYTQLMACRPGAIFSASRAQRCAQAQSDVPLQMHDQLEAEDRLDVALVDYQEKQRLVGQACRLDEAVDNQQDLLLRIASLENEINALKNLVGKLTAQ